MRQLGILCLVMGDQLTEKRGTTVSNSVPSKTRTILSRSITKWATFNITSSTLTSQSASDPEQTQDFTKPLEIPWLYRFLLQSTCKPVCNVFVICYEKDVILINYCRFTERVVVNTVPTVNCFTAFCFISSVCFTF